MFFELAFGICIGCKIYALLHKGEVKYCPGEVCELKDRQEIQKTSAVQWAVVVAFGLLLYGLFYFFQDTLIIMPKDLKEVIASWK
jgi:hypothetical protein